MRLTAAEWIALGAAVAVRVAALWSVEQTVYADFPVVDAQTYWQQAQALLSGEDPFSAGLYQPPGYPSALAALGWVLGELTLPAVRRLQLLLGVATSVGLLALGRRLGTPAGAPWAGAVAVLLYALYPTTLLFEHDLLTPALTNAALVGALLCLLGAPWWKAPVAGALSGLAVVCHPTYLLAVGWLGAWRSRQAGGRAALLGFAVVLGLALAPTTLRNHKDFGTLTLVSHNAGLNFFLGNNPDWRTTAALRAGIDFRQLVLEAEPHRRDAAERDAYWKQRARDGIVSYPVSWASTLAAKSYWSIHSTEIPRNEDYRCRVEAPSMRWLAWLPVRYGLVFPLALLGAVRVVRRREGEGVAVVGAWAMLHLPMILFLVADRYRLATWPMVCLLAPLGVVALRELLAARSVWLVGAAAAAVLPWLPISDTVKKDPAWCLHAQGNMAFVQEEKAEALRLYEASLALDADNLAARTYIASILYQQRRYGPAAEQMEIVLRAFPDHFPSLNLMSSIQRRMGNLDAAATYLGRAYAVPGQRRSTGVRYVKLLVEAGRVEEARQVVREHEELQRDRRVRELFSGGR